jgi:hypothetical protein
MRRMYGWMKRACPLWENDGVHNGWGHGGPPFQTQLADAMSPSASPSETPQDLGLTLIQYDQQVSQCRQLFLDKMHDYGTAWRVLRPASLTDQIFIKAQRIRTLQEGAERQVDEGIRPEFVGIVNYCMMALLQLELTEDVPLDLPKDEATRRFDEALSNTRTLMMRKNHDYGEAWRDMRVSSLTDLILMKLLRIKQLEDLKGGAKVSEGVDAGYMDMANYALFALIHLAQAPPTQA